MLEIARVSHAYGDVVSLRDISLQVAPGEILCLLGPSGCGKTTLLRIIAGLEDNFDGTIAFAGVDLRGVAAHQRQFGLMFQDFALFPHLTVAGNIGYGLGRQGLSRAEIKRRVGELMERIGLAGLERRDIATLSGGQKQRVALARSLAPQPRLLMLDEPLGSLDAQLRDELALELRRIIKARGLSAVYVTHDHREAYAVADRIGVMRIGSLEQQDTPQALYANPRTAFVARFLGLRNIFSLDHNALTRELASQRGLGGAGALLIHPGGIRLSGANGEGAVEIRGVLRSAVFRGHFFDVTVDCGDDMRLRFPARGLPSPVGGDVAISISRNAIKPLLAPVTGGGAPL